VKLATWNVNSLRVRLPRVVDWLAREQPDVLCLQETKCTDDQFPRDPLVGLGYQCAIHGQKTYNGVAILARTPLHDVKTGFSDPTLDESARVLRATVSGVRVFCLYVPNGAEVGSDKYAFKLRWLAGLRALLDQEHTSADVLALCGDFNVAPEDRDVHDPDQWREQILCSTPERAALRQVAAFGLTDALRHMTQEQVFTWWDYRAGAFHRGWGLRIDHVFVSAPLLPRVRSVRVDRDARKGKEPSDHAPVVVELA
jgi:exodeoxyribonuclease-3